MRIAWVTRSLPHYRLPFLQALCNAGVECQVVVAGSGKHFFASSFEVNVPGLSILDRRRTGFHYRQDVLDALKPWDWDALVVEHGTSLDFAWLLLLSGAHPKIPRILWTHGVDRQEHYTGRVSPTGWGRWFQLHKADGVICYDPDTAKKLQAKFRGKTIGVAPNSTDTKPILAWRAHSDPKSLRTERRMQRHFYLSGLGRLIPTKRFDRVLHIAAQVRKKGLDVGVIYIGDGPERASIERQAASLGFAKGDVIFAGMELDPVKVAEWLICSDACVNPGAMGLSVVDCLSAGVPVFAYRGGPNGPYHGPECTYLEDGETGALVEAMDEDALVTAIARYLSLSEQERANCSRRCIQYSDAHLGVERMAMGFIGAIERVMGRRGVEPCAA